MSHTSSMTELRRMTRDELRRDITAKRNEYAKTRLHVQAHGEKNHGKVKLMRRDIARMTMVYEQMPVPAMPEQKKGAEGAEVKAKAPAKNSAKKTSVRSARSVPSVSSKKK